MYMYNINCPSPSPSSLCWMDGVWTGNTFSSYYHLIANQCVPRLGRTSKAHSIVHYNSVLAHWGPDGTSTHRVIVKDGWYMDRIKVHPLYSISIAKQPQ